MPTCPWDVFVGRRRFGHCCRHCQKAELPGSGVSIGFNGWGGSEHEQAALYAKHLAVSHRIKLLNPGDLSSSHDIAALVDELMQTPPCCRRTNSVSSHASTLRWRSQAMVRMNCSAGMGDTSRRWQTFTPGPKQPNGVQNIIPVESWCLMRAKSNR